MPHLESAVVKLESRLRRGKDRRKVHYGDKTPVSLAEATAVAQLPDKAFNAEPADAHQHERTRAWTMSRAEWCAPKTTRPRRCRSMTRSTRWSWLGTTSFCSTTSNRIAVRRLPSPRLRLRADSAGLIRRLDPDRLEDRRLSKGSSPTMESRLIEEDSYLQGHSCAVEVVLRLGEGRMVKRLKR